MLGRVHEIGVDDDALHIRNHQQRRIEQRFPVLQQLLIGRIQVFVLALVLPGEKALLPYICPALTAALLADTRLEGEGVAGGIGLRWRGMPHQAAKIDEMLLRCGAFFQLRMTPFGDEILW